MNNEDVIDWENSSPENFPRFRVVDTETNEEIPYVLRCNRVTGEVVRAWPVPPEHDRNTDTVKRITEIRNFKLVPVGATSK